MQSRYLVTRNVRDFQPALISVVQPVELIALVREGTGKGYFSCTPGLDPIAGRFLTQDSFSGYSDFRNHKTPMFMG